MRTPWLVLCLALLALACASPPQPYRPTDSWHVKRQFVIEDGKPQIEQGRPNRFIDGLSHYVLSLPAKLLLWNWQIIDHDLPEDHERVLEHYLELNQLESVKIRHNQYDPRGWAPATATPSGSWPGSATR